ncbi:MAG: cytochrome b/b6 domain-containing protein [Steroidobacteraceae bacterium]
MTRRILVWDLPVRVFHWLLATAFVAAYVLSESERWRLVHVTLGYIVLALVVFRLLWGFIGTRYARFGSFAYGPGAAMGYLRRLLRREPAEYVGPNPAGSWAVYGMLALALLTGITGWLQYNEIGGDTFEEIHEVIGNAWLVLVLFHVAGVIASSLAHRENLPRAMVTGYKDSETAEPAEGNRAMIAVLLFVVVGAIWAGMSATSPSGSLLAPLEKTEHQQSAGRGDGGDEHDKRDKHGED